MVRVDAAQRELVDVINTSGVLLDAKQPTPQAPEAVALGKMLSNGVVTILVNQPCPEGDSCEDMDTRLLQLIRLGKEADLSQINEVNGKVFFTYSIENISAESLENYRPVRLPLRQLR